MQEEQKPDSKQPETNWEFNAQDAEATQPAAPGQTSEAVSWSASEYIAHDKDQSWYVTTGVAIIIFAAIIYFLDQNRGWITPLLIVLAGATFIFSATRKPKTLNYSVDSTGVHIGEKTYAYADFKSFSIIEEGAIDSIMLTPMQRFMPSLTIYFEPRDEEKISEALGAYLPYEERKQDPIDKLMRKIRF